MKKMYIFFALLSFSLFISIVRADTYNVTVPSNLTSLTSFNFDTMINTLNNSSITHKQYCTITWTTSSGNYYKLRCGNSVSYNSNFDSYSLGYCSQYDYSSDFTSITPSSYHPNCTGDRFTYYIRPRDAQISFLIYSNFDLPIQNVSNTYNYTYIDKVYTMPNGTDVKVYSIREMYIDYNTDPYPLFTSFFDIVLEKLQLVCEFFTSSYIYLSIFVVIMFYFIILLLRRLT